MSERLTLRTPRRPNVVWIFGDQHRSHATSYRGDGNVFTPNIDNYVRLWRPVVDAICAREGIAYQRIEAPESSTNAVFILDRRVVIKIYSPFWTEFEFERGSICWRATGKCRCRQSGRQGCFGTGPIGATSRCSSAPDARSTSCSRSWPGRPCWRWPPKPGAWFGLHAVDPEPVAAVDKGESWGTLVDRRRREVLPELVDRGLIVPAIVPELETVTTAAGCSA